MSISAILDVIPAALLHQQNGVGSVTKRMKPCFKIKLPDLIPRFIFLLLESVNVVLHLFTYNVTSRRDSSARCSCNQMD